MSLESTETNEKLQFGGFLKNSLIDYPGNISFVLFTRGCNFRCYYCHNPELVWPEKYQKENDFDTDDILSWIIKNKQLLDAVVITGGEPSIHHVLPGFIKKIKAFGLKVKLDTNGTNPDMLNMLIKESLVDYVAMDIKAPLQEKEYKKIICVSDTANLLGKVKQSVSILNEGTIPYEYRTTVDRKFNTKRIEAILPDLKGDYFLQPYTDHNNMNRYFGLEKIRKEIRNQNSHLRIHYRI